MRRGSWIDPLFLAVALAVYGFDQATKLLVVRELGPDAERHSVEVVGDWVRLSYATNTGAAFGIFPNQPHVFTAIALVAIPAIWLFNRSVRPRTPLTRVCLGGLLGGALGNLTDRLRLGHVVDFVDVGIGTLRWPAFNVADSAFVVGILVLCFFVFLRDEPEPSAQRDQTYA